MTEFTIAGGSVEYRHTKPGAQYESTVPAVTLHFTVENGSDPETVTRKVMSMARNVVEDTLKGTLDRLGPASVSAQPGLTETVQPSPPATAPSSTQRKRKQAETPTGAVQGDAAPLTADVNPLEALAAGSSPTESEPEPEDDLAALSGKTDTKQPTVEDLQKALMATSAHLRKEVGHINDIKKLLTTFGVAGWGALKPEQYPDFIAKCKALLDLKKE
jgi:hypothetical protein